MKVFTETVGDAAAPLTCYLLDATDQMAAARVRPAVLVLPGGGYRYTSDREAEPIAMAYLAEGFHAFVLRYAAGPDAPFEASFGDGRAALAWVRAHADELHVDPGRVAVVGFSAGGHLAASLGTAADDKPDALVLGYPVTLEEFGPPIGKELLDVPGAVGPDTPPTFLFSTSGDRVVPIRNSLSFLSALAEHDVPFESHIYLLGPHGISLAKPLTANGAAAMVDGAVAQWLPDSVRFLRTVFGDFATEGEGETFQTLVDRRRPGIQTPVRRLLVHDRAAAILERHVPGLGEAVRANRVSASLSLADMAQWEPDRLTAEVLDALARDLASLDG